MDWSEEFRIGLNRAIHEAWVKDVVFDPATRRATIELKLVDVLSDEPQPRYDHVTLILQPVGRIATSLRDVADDREEIVQSYDLSQIGEVVQSFGPIDGIYSWDYFDVPDAKDFASWSDCLSVDYHSGEPDGWTHTLEFWHEGFRPHRIHDVRFWFDNLEVRDEAGAIVSFAGFIVDGNIRWLPRAF